MMKNKIVAGALSILLLYSCNSNHGKNQENLSVKNEDSIKRRQLIDSEMALAERPDSEQEGPSFNEVLKQRIDSYNEILNIDKSTIVDKDSVLFHYKFYCLHDSSLIVPKHYIWGSDKSRDFVTHNFAVQVVLIKNKDTLLNKVFKKIDFKDALSEPLRNYATFIDADFIGFDKVKEEFAVGFSMSIPLTDVGVPVCLVVDKNGKYRVLDEYAKLDNFKKI